MEINIKLLTPTAKIPEKMSADAAGYDIYADITDDIIIKPSQRALIPTGFAISIPSGHEAQIRPRSGLAIKHGITVLNSPGTIDADYRGEVKVILINLSQQDFTLTPSMRIAQMVIVKHQCCDFIPVVSLDDTQRGEGGFGSSK